jgi:hypothetical protein
MHDIVGLCLAQVLAVSLAMAFWLYRGCGCDIRDRPFSAAAVQMHQSWRISIMNLPLPVRRVKDPRRIERLP